MVDLPVPIIDLASPRDGTGRQDIAQEIAKACESVGFLVITGHGVPGEILDSMVETSRAFFSLPVERRCEAMPDVPHVFRGYFPSQASALAASLDIETPPDLCEVYCVNRFDDPETAKSAGMAPGLEGFFAPNIWPRELPAFKPAWQAYYRAMEELVGELLSLMAEALYLPGDWFVPFCDRHTTNLVANYYPPQLEAPDEGQLRRGAHTDYGSVSILYQADSVSGLQIRLDGEWVDIPYVDNSFIVNLGDLMAVWTNDRWVSTMHRVVNPRPMEASSSRISIVFFHQPNFNARIECIPTCVSDASPVKYEPVLAGPWVLEKLTKSVG